MTSNFESQKNIKAAGYTSGVILLLLLILFYVKWVSPLIPAPLPDEGIEVNLGNSDMGLGDDQPFEPGEPSPQDQQSYTTPSTNAVSDNAVKEIETDDTDEEAPAIAKPPVVKPDAKKIPEKETVTKPVKKTTPVPNPTPVPPKPRAVFKGVSGAGTGGNNADTYKKGGSEGVAGGTGDQGRAGGDPNSKNYEGGGTGNSGVTVSRGLRGRSILSLPSFTDEFNENAKVAIDIKVDENGKVTAATYQPRGSTTSANNLKTIAIRKALSIKFSSSADESTGTLIFNFKVTQ